MIPVIDLFAGPGGLGEGFSACRTPRLAPAFDVVASAEKDGAAHQTLRLRSFYRALTRKGSVPDSYYEYVSGQRAEPFDAGTKSAWENAGAEALQLTLGAPKDNSILKAAVASRVNTHKPWVLIGGPPCQAYSLVGRVRNAGIKGYRPELDKRNFLYREYLRILGEYRPSVFVMENVKGLLSSKVAGSRIFHQILADLSKPSAATGRTSEYAIYSLTAPSRYAHGQDPEEIDPGSFVVRCEDFGVPQRRHRVILIGVRKDLDQRRVPPLAPHPERVSVDEAIGDLTVLRSGLSTNDSPASWARVVKEQVALARSAVWSRPDGDRLTHVLTAIQRGTLPADRGGQWIPHQSLAHMSSYAKGLSDKRLEGTLNHWTRGHMAADLARYAFLAAYGKIHGRSPSAHDFPKDLAAKHRNWNSGHFADRFRVQVSGEPATTITSHISKDGHYYVHPDPKQCRSFTVREAARIQSFPDNYFFEGTRTQQFTQVGNAVPPLVATQIASVVRKILA